MIRLMVEERMWFSFLGNAFHQVLVSEENLCPFYTARLVVVE